MTERKTLCWSCSNCGKCSWANGVPVEGWTAKKTRLKEANNVVTHSYFVEKCPKFEYDGLCSRCIYGCDNIPNPEKWFENCAEKTANATFDTCSHFVNGYEVELEEEYAHVLCYRHKIDCVGYISYIAMWEILLKLKLNWDLSLGSMCTGIRPYGEKNMGYVEMNPYKLYKISEFICSRLKDNNGECSIEFLMEYISQNLVKTIKRGQKAV